MKAYIVSYGVPELLPYQFAALRKFCPDIGEIRIANVGPDYSATEAVCKKLNVSSFYVIHSPRINCESHAYALNQLWQMWGAWDGDGALILDHDVFPIKRTLPREWLNEHLVAGRIDNRGIDYPWPGLLAIHPGAPCRERIFFNPVHVNGGFNATGGMMGFWMKTHAIEPKRLTYRYGDSSVGDDKDWEFYEDAWLHINDASNWSGKYDKRARIEHAMAFLRSKGVQP